MFHEEVLHSRNVTEQRTDEWYGRLGRRWFSCVLCEVEESRKKYISRSQTTDEQREGRSHCSTPGILPKPEFWVRTCDESSYVVTKKDDQGSSEMHAQYMKVDIHSTLERWYKVQRMYVTTSRRLIYQEKEKWDLLEDGLQLGKGKPFLDIASSMMSQLLCRLLVRRLYCVGVGG